MDDPLTKLEQAEILLKKCDYEISASQSNRTWHNSTKMLYLNVLSRERRVLIEAIKSLGGIVEEVVTPTGGDSREKAGVS